MLVGLAAVALSACSPAPTPADTIVVGIEGNPTDLDPRFSTDAHSSRIGGLLYNGLLKLDERDQLVGDLARAWRWEGDRQLIFDLQEGIHFSNGAAFTCEDARATLAWTAQPDHGSPKAAAYEGVEEIACQSPTRLSVRLKSPFAPMPYELTLGILPASALDQRQAVPPGTGPYRLLEWVPDQRLVVERLPQPNGPQDRWPAIPRIEFRILPEETTRLQEMMRGGIDLLFNAAPPHKLKLFDDRSDIRILSRPGATYTYLGLNLTLPILADPKVRRALALGIDRDAILLHRLGGRARKAQGLLSPLNWAYADDLPATPYDPKEAERLLDEAGHARKADGWRFRLRYHTSAADEALTMAAIIKSQWEMIGVGVDIRSYEWGAFFRDVRTGQYDVFSLRWIGAQDPDFLYTTYHSTMVPPKGSNRVFYANPQVDALLERARASINPDERAPLYREVQHSLNRDLPVISLFHLDDVALVGPRLVDYDQHPGGRLTGLLTARIQPK